jgi:hypothetical protein
LINAGAMFDNTQYTVQYEMLRLQVIGTGGDQACGVGLALLLNEGMPGWLKAVEGVLRTSLSLQAVDSPNAAPSNGSTESISVPAWLSIMQRHEVATLLASLVLSIHPLACQSSKEEYRTW